MESLADDILNASREEKIEYLRRITTDEDRFFQNYDPVLERFLDDQDEEVRALSLAALWDYPREELIDRLFDIVHHDPSPEVRAKAVALLGRFIFEGADADYDFSWGPEEVETLPQEDFERVVRFVMDLIEDETTPLEMRRLAVEAISFLIEPEVINVIREAYEHPDPAMKTSALFAMGRNGNEIWTGILLKELESPVPEMQYEATRAAGEYCLREAAPTLMRLAESGDEDLALEAIWSLGKTGGPGVRDFLEDCTTSRNPDTGEIAKAALEELNLTEMIEDMDMPFGPPEEVEDFDGDYEDEA